MECGDVLHKHDCDYYASVHSYYVLLTLLCISVWVGCFRHHNMRFYPPQEIFIKFRPAAPEIMGQTGTKVQI